MGRQWPMKKGAYTLTSGFGPRWGAHHSGLDFGAPDGTPFYACAGGTVQFIGSASGYGQWIVIDHPDSEGGGCTEYGHMWNAFATGLRQGQWVNAGQLIGYVGSNGQSTGPHLHLTVWERGYGGKRIDPEVWLQNAPHPGETTQPASSRTIFGVDVSEHQNGMSLKQAALEGIDFAIVRTTDGTYKDRTYLSHLADAESAGLITAAYHYLRNPSEGTSIAQQVQAALQVMGDKKRPMWIDVETNAGLHVDHIRECKRLFEAHGVPVIGAYSYVPYWEGKVAPNEPDSHEFGHFWVAAYGANRSGKPKDIYPGDTHRQWNYPLGNQKPAMWQYGSNAQVAGYSVDINAFRGTREQLIALFYGADRSKEEQKMFGEVQVAALNDAKLAAQAAQRDAAAAKRNTELILDQLVGYEKDAKGHRYTGWKQLKGMTLIDAVAELLNKEDK